MPPPSEPRRATPAARPQLTVDELLQLRWLLGGLLILLAISTVLYMDVEAWTLMALAATATIAVTLNPGLPARIPGVVHTLAFPIIVSFFALDLWIFTEVLPAMVRLDILLLLYRAINYRQRRDDLQIIVLGLFLIVIAGVLTVSLTFAAQILLFTACALVFLLVITLTDAALATQAPATPAPGRGTPAWVAHANWPQLYRRVRAAVDWRVLGFGGFLFAAVVAISVVLFLAIPRFQLQNSMFLDRFITKKAKSGFSDSIRLGEVTEIQQDNSVALSVDVSDRSRIPASPYWRMLVLDHYEGGTFKLSPALRGQFGRERTNAQIHGDARLATDSPVFWTFYLESGISRYLPLIGRFHHLQFREAQNYRYAPHLSVLALRDEPVAMTAYRMEEVELSAFLPDPHFTQRWRDREQAGNRGGLQILTVVRPTDRAVLARLTEEATGGARLTVQEFAIKVGEYLRKNHRYSLSPRIPPGDGDPLIRWMDSDEAGHCELFAGALVMLARTAGIPARVVTGFRGGTWNAYSDNFTIRNADAHAWVELFDETAGGWLRADALDASAGSTLADTQGEAALERRLDRSWAARLDSLRVFWYRRIVSFDQQSQIETFKAVKEATQNTGKRLRETIGRVLGNVKAWLTRPWDAARIGRVCLVLGTLVGAGWLLWTYALPWWRGVRRRRGKSEDPVRREAGMWLRRAVDAGVRDASLLARLQRLRFGARTTWPDPERVFRETRRSIRGARRRERQTEV